MIINAIHSSEYWCPFGKGRKVLEKDDDPEACQGAECAAWRWVSDSDQSNMGGYCGLAGVPLSLTQSAAKVKNV